MPAWESRSHVVWRFVGTIGPFAGWFVLGLVGCSYHLAGPLKFGKGAPGRGGLSSGWGLRKTQDRARVGATSERVQRLDPFLVPPRARGENLVDRLDRGLGVRLGVRLSGQVPIFRRSRPYPPYFAV